MILPDFGTVATLCISAAVAIIGALTSEKGRGVRVALFVLTLAAFAASFYAAQSAAVKSHENARKAVEFEGQFKIAQRTIAETSTSVTSVSATVEDLAMLNKLSSQLFHVRISAGNDLNDLRKTAARIGWQIPGALESGMVRLQRTPPNKPGVETEYQLLFGRDLTLAAAGVFHRLAIDHAFANGRPAIEVETAAERTGDLLMKPERPGA